MMNREIFYGTFWPWKMEIGNSKGGGIGFLNLETLCKCQFIFLFSVDLAHFCTINLFCMYWQYVSIRKYLLCCHFQNCTVMKNFTCTCLCQKQPPEFFCKKKAVLKNFAIFTGKHLCFTLFLIKLQAFRPTANGCLCCVSWKLITS